MNISPFSFHHNPEKQVDIVMSILLMKNIEAQRVSVTCLRSED